MNEVTIHNLESETGYNKRMVCIFIFALIGLIVLDVVILINFSADTKIILHNPVSGGNYPQTFTAMGFSWDRDSIETGADISVTIILKNESNGETFFFPALRSAVRNGQMSLFHLASYSSTISVPADTKNGNWIIIARMTTDAGYSVETKSRVISIEPEARLGEFRFFSAEHIIALIILLVCSIIIVFIFKNARNRHLRPAVALFLVSVLWVNEIIYHIYWSWVGAWIPGNSMMFHMCGIAILIIPFALYTRNDKVRLYLTEVIFFWGLGGALQALLTPDIGTHGFPEYKYFAYFIAHGFIILISLFLITAYKIRIRLASYLRAIVTTNVALIVTFIFNHLFKFIPPFDMGNYFAVGYPPPDGSVIDFFVKVFGPSPWYIIGLEIMGLLVFGLLCLPFLFMKISPKTMN